MVYAPGSDGRLPLGDLLFAVQEVVVAVADQAQVFFESLGFLSGLASHVQKGTRPAEFMACKRSMRGVVPCEARRSVASPWTPRRCTSTSRISRRGAGVSVRG